MASDIPANFNQLAGGHIKRSTNDRYSGKLRLITRDQIDKRTKARRKFDAIANSIAKDLGGEDQLSTIEKHLIEAFSGIAICVNDMNARIMLGQDFDILSLSNAASTMVRIGSRLGTKRIARDIISTPPGVADYVDYIEQQTADTSR